MKTIVGQLQQNKFVFNEILKEVDPEMIRWRPATDKWSLLEVVCHLYDEERFDFRFRVKWVLEKPGEIPPPFNPLDWVSEHKYEEQEYQLMIGKFLAERERSTNWLQSLASPNWGHSFEHPKLGKLTAKYFLENWLAHDYLHMRQISKLKYNYLELHSGGALIYAGRW